MERFLNELQSKQLLSSVNIPIAKGKLANSEDEAEKIANEIGYPVVMKILSSDIQHKTEANCVFINIKDANEARKTYGKIIENAIKYDANAKIDGVLIQELAPKGLELIIGMKKDPQFGPVIMFGLGGIYVEVFKDIALRLLPVDEIEAKNMIKETSVSKIIEGARGIEYDLDTLVDTLLKVSELVQKQNNIDEIDINPFFLYEKGKGGMGVDALIKIK